MGSKTNKQTKDTKKKGILKKVIYFVLAIIVIFVIQITYMVMKSNGIFSAGNKEEFSVSNTESLSDSPLKGKTIIFLGSSVTFGSASKEESFVDFMEKKDGILPIKKAVSGTVLVDEEVYGKKSYIERLKTIDKSIKADAFVCQLSTNDATMKKKLGTVSESFDMQDFDTHTVAGAIEYIIAYSRETWNCPVVFYTGSKYKSERYAEMVDLLLEIQKKWDIGVIDMWNNEKMNAVNEEDYKLYMVNGIHPSRAGYKEWWTPVIEEYLYTYLTK